MKSRWGRLASGVVAVGALIVIALLVRRWWVAPRQDVTIVRRGDLHASADALGRVHPKRQAKLSTRASGMVARLYVHEGQSVTQGELLLELDAQDELAAIEQAERTLAVRRMQLDEALQAPSPSEIALARARLRRATAARQKAQDDYDKVAAKPRTETSDEALDLEAAKLEYEVAQAEFDRMMEGASELEIERLRTELRGAELSLQQAQRQLERTRIYAPFTGVVLRVEPREGENVYAYNPLITLADLSAFEIVAEIDEIDVASVAEGQQVEVRLDAFPAQILRGRVTRVSPGPVEGRGSTLYEAGVDFDANAEGQVLPIRMGMGANLTIITQEVQDALLIPKRAIRQAGRRQVVRVIEGRAAQEVIVETGYSDGTDIQVLSGREEGQTIALNP